MDPTVANTIVLRPFTAGDTDLVEGAVTVHARTWQYAWDDSYHTIWRYVRTYPDFYGFVACLPDGEVVGMIFGTRSLPGQWWHDRVAAQVGANHPALQNAWLVTEFAVLREHRGTGIGSRLHDAILAAQPYPRVLLSTAVNNMAARVFYERRGWLYLHPGMSFEPGDPKYLVMYKELSN